LFYYLSKIAWSFTSPSNLFAGITLLGVLLSLTRLRRTGVTLALGGVLSILVLGLSPAANYLILPLEERFPSFRDDGAPVHGIIYLGGALDSRESSARGAVIVNESAERVLAVAELAFRYPDARILLSGGGGTMFSDGTAEAPIVARYLQSLGVAPDRFIIEDQSRTTAENATLSRALIEPKPGERWLLVTSAWHMPRAVGTFRQVGLPVTAYPVDHRTGGVAKAFPFVSDGLRRLDVVVKEWIGLLGYYLTDRTDVLFPAP
jgi:uncharacterized SAM-binding protein YcdF (DUF218 family)